MHTARRLTIIAAALCLLASAAHAQQRTGRILPPFKPPAPSAPLQGAVDAAAREVLEKFGAKGLKEDKLAITVIDLSDPNHETWASYRGREPIYPASVVKLFYLVAAHRWLEDGRLRDSEELRRALHDMIVDSSNDATHYIVDALSGVSNGAELSEGEMKKWAERRNGVNRYFASLGYTVGPGGINVNQKPWCEGPYGRERVFLGKNFENRNKLTTEATARLLYQIVRGEAVTRERSAAMLALMRRDFSGKSDDPDDQAHGFTGIALEPGTGYWSKAGWTSTARHDAAYLELPNGRRLIIVTFTTDNAKERDIIPTVAQAVIKGVSGER